MANLEILVSELPTIIQNLKLTIGDSNQIMEQIILINNAQEQLRNIKKLIAQELRFDRINNSAIATLPRLITGATLFMPSLGLVDPAISEKFGNSETKISLTDLQSKIDAWIEWGYFLQAIAADILSDIQLVNQLDSDIVNVSIYNELKIFNDRLKINLALDKANILREQVEKIRDYQKQLLQLGQKLDYIFDTIKNSRSLLNILLGVSAFYGKSGFALEWLDDDHELIISSQGKFQELTDILNDCDSFQEQIAALIIQGDTLSLQAEQSLKKIEQESSKEEISNQPVETVPKFSTPKIVRSALIIASSLLILTFCSLKIREQNLSLTQEGSANANFKSAQKLGMEAASLVQKPPHPLKVWQQAETKWYQAIILLDKIPAKTSVYDRAKKKLAYYQINYKSISQRVLIEKKALANLESAHKLATEANLFVQNSPNSQLSRQQAQDKWQQAINLLKAIPQSTSVSVQAKEMLSIYKTNYAATSQQS
ncbi:hypothetical protein CDG76_01750 [Nostoc sp. 'Peltigera membranacea cyanobiont' 210A]|uniref:hypothetical protein n=1 Tax=Nostoc sp. 'Peltigera membranacea cyanobiont' 210A TaxID=2014529 RepID=UPI000B952340|nr:hypothetical protein [Nostoc sp. 'Peltigera membranacea cyanobiont' 210A]OYD98165.1 hypothetical protein CDG76_01750 [Nostoc sp. 'Peltigera membranacea cyanobiont' 210A]